MYGVYLVNIYARPQDAKKRGILRKLQVLFLDRAAWHYLL